ncbi:MAG: hypothetical protein J6H20_03465, partial [Pyramidobacter sp.]|nr:hypothetical protein [Pyramidobacter sp.]
CTPFGPGKATPTEKTKTQAKSARKRSSAFRLCFYETLIKYVISCETLPPQEEGAPLGLRQYARARPLRTGFFGFAAFSLVSCALVHFGIMGLNQRFFRGAASR